MAMADTLYQELDTNIHEIRLLSLAPGKGDDPVTATLSTVSLISEPPPLYETISYVWGDPNLRNDVEINGMKIPITTNLEAALAAMRWPNRARTLWADALCINQRDIGERSRQVRFMDKIYRQCERVLIYLGPAAPLDTELFNFMDSLDGSVHNFEPCQENPNDHTWTCHSPLQFLGSLMGKAWWSRTWTVQELILAPEATLICGAKQVTWERLFEVWKAVEVVTRGCGALCLTCAANLRLFFAVTSLHVLRKQQAKGGQDLLDIVIQGSILVTTDPRDKIFAFLAMSNVSYDITPDYHSTTEDVYLNFAWNSLRRLQSLKVLTNVFDNRKSRYQLPSWVPDWSLRPIIPSCNVSLRAIIYSSYQACGDTKFTGKPILTATVPFLCLCGMKAGVISKVSGRFMYPDPTNVRRCLKLFKITAEPQKPYVTGSYNQKDAFWRTVLTDRIAGHPNRREYHNPAPSSFEGHFWDYIYLRNQTENSASRNWDDMRLTIGSLSVFAEANRFAMLQEGHFVNGSPAMKEGDEVWVVKGGNRPLILRQVDASNHHERVPSQYTPQFEYVGDCYVHGIMNGEMIPKNEEGYQEIYLI